MAKYKLWPGNKLDALVDEFLRRKHIDPNDVLDYRLGRSGNDLPTITLTMHYDEGPEQADVTGLDRADREYLPRVTKDNPYIVGEQGPEAYVPPHHQV